MAIAINTACKEMVKNKYRFLDDAGLNFRYLYFIELSLHAARQSPQRQFNKI